MSLRIVHYVPRLGCGGMEAELLGQLEAFPGSEVAYAHDGPLRPAVERLAARVTNVWHDFDRARALFAGADIVHLHAINHFLFPALAAQVAGARVIVQTIHNFLTPAYSHFVDWSVIAHRGLKECLIDPAHATPLPNGLAVPAVAPWRAPWDGARKLRLLEVRRPDKAMTYTLEALLATGALDHLPIEAEVVGIEGTCTDPRVRNCGVVADPTPYFAAADLLVSGSAGDTFGRTVFEAMAHGAWPVATSLPCFAHLCREEACIDFFPADAPAEAAARHLARVVEAYAQNPDAVARRRLGNHAFVQRAFARAVVTERWRELYGQLLAAPAFYRNFTPADVPRGSEAALGAAMDSIAAGDAAGALRQADALPPSARAIVAWVVAHSGSLTPTGRVQLLQPCLDALGPRHLVLLDLATAAAELGQTALAEDVLSFADRLRPTQLLAPLERAHLALKRGEVETARHLEREVHRRAAALPQMPGARAAA